MLSLSIEQKSKARKASLYKFCTKNHSDLFESVSLNYIQMKSNPNIQISKTGFGYIDLANGKQTNKFGTSASANPIDFLIRFLRYNFYDAVIQLSKDEYQFTAKHQPREFVVPEQASCDDALFNYLNFLHISDNLINHLKEKGLIYLSANVDHIIFLNEQKNYGERMGTDIHDYFYRLLTGVASDECWSFSDIENYDTAYICTTALEAISLYELNKKFNKIKNGLFVSIGNPQRIRAIKKLLNNPQIKEVVLASANIPRCDERITKTISPRPVFKSWNKQLICTT